MFFWTLVISVGTIVGDIFLKHAAESKNSWLLVIGMLLYAVDATLWFWVYKTAKFSTVGIVYSIFTILLTVCIGVFYFKEQLGVRELVGIFLGVTSVILLSRFSS